MEAVEELIDRERDDTIGIGAKHQVSTLIGLVDVDLADDRTGGEVDLADREARDVVKTHLVKVPRDGGEARAARAAVAVVVGVATPSGVGPALAQQRVGVTTEAFVVAEESLGQ